MPESILFSFVINGYSMLCTVIVALPFDKQLNENELFLFVIVNTFSSEEVTLNVDIESYGVIEIFKVYDFPT